MLTDEEVQQVQVRAQALADSLGLDSTERLIEYYIKSGLTFTDAIRKIAFECGITRGARCQTQ